MKITRYCLTTEKKGIDSVIAVVSDLHARPCDKVIEALKRISPDIILLPGDILEVARDYMSDRNRNGFDFLKRVSKIAPCYYCLGNHEIYFSHAKKGQDKATDPSLSQKHLETVSSYGVRLVNDCFENLGEINIGGLVCGRDMDPALETKEPDLAFLSEFDKAEGYKILLCHYPHYYEKYLKNTTFDLILSGHAHGGQWEIFGRGVYAPHQGLFPKYTHGIHDGRHVISRGAANNVFPIPRFFNPCEILEIRIKSKD